MVLSLPTCRVADIEFAGDGYALFLFEPLICLIRLLIG